MQHLKVKDTVSKILLPRGDRLQGLVRETMRTISGLVGSTLGPGGLTIGIERQETGLPPFVTKDGVTVFRALGFRDPLADLVMVMARDAAVRTASEAGDGTTTATVLAEAFVDRTFTFCAANPEVSPQLVVRRLMAMFRDQLEPALRKMAIPVRLDECPDCTDHRDEIGPDGQVQPCATCKDSPRGRDLLRAVAMISGNGDEPLADAALKAFDAVGDDGHVTIVERSGPSRYEVEQVAGYSLEIGYDDSCQRFYPAFINDQGRMRAHLSSPHVLLYHGRITSVDDLMPLLNKFGEQLQNRQTMLGSNNPGATYHGTAQSPHWVVIATGFSEEVLAWMAQGFSSPSVIMKVLPLLVPQGPQLNYQHQILQDIAALTGSIVLDPLRAPLGKALPLAVGPGVLEVEIYRNRATIIGAASDTVSNLKRQEEYRATLLRRVQELQEQAKQAASQYDGDIIRYRAAKLASGVAQLIVYGSSNAELRERRDRAEDAVCSIRGAVKHGCLPGCGKALLRLPIVSRSPLDSRLVDEILRPALQAPAERILRNAGLPIEKICLIVAELSCDTALTYDALAHGMVDPVEAGLLDSAQAVIEALRNGMSIALQLGTLGGLIAHPRDPTLEREEAGAVAEWERNIGMNEADNRA